MKKLTALIAVLLLACLVVPALAYEIVPEFPATVPVQDREELIGEWSPSALLMTSEQSDSQLPSGTVISVSPADMGMDKLSITITESAFNFYTPDEIVCTWELTEDGAIATVDPEGGQNTFLYTEGGIAYGFYMDNVIPGVKFTLFFTRDPEA